MSNTGRNKKLASFNCDEELWSSCVTARNKGQPRRPLTSFIQLYLDGKLDNLDADAGRLLVDEYQQHLPSHLDKYLATGQDKQLYSTVALSEKIGSLEARLFTTNARTYPKTNPLKEREFWFIQDRARYLGVSINADQRLKIEMFANAIIRSGMDSHGNHIEAIKLLLIQ